MKPGARWWLQAALPFAAAAIVAPRALETITETDAGWHLAVGRSIASGGILRTNLLSWTAPDFGWYPTSWLYDVLAYASINAGGVRALQLMTLLFVAGALAATVAACRVVEPRWGGWLAVAAALLILPRITVRPHVATWTVLAIVLWLCLKARGHDWRWRAAALPVITVGANLHSGAAFPLAVMGIFCIEAGYLEGHWRREGVLIGVAVLAFLANPGGLFNVHYLVQHLFVQDVVRLGEFEHPTLKRAPLFFATVLASVAAAWVCRKQYPAFLPLSLLFAGLGLYALRLVYEFSLVAAPVLAAGVDQIGRRSPRLTTGVLVAALLCVLGARERYWTEWHVSPTFDASVLPVGAAEFLRAHDLGDRGFNAFRDGGYLEWAVPGFRAYQDARIQAYPPEFFPAETTAEGSPAAFQSYLREHGVEWAVASRVKEPLSGWHLLGGPDWGLIYWDAASEIYVRRDVARFVPIIASLEYRAFRPSLNPERIASLSPDGVRRVAEEATRASRTWDFPEAEILRCLALRRLGAADATAACLRATDMADPAQLAELARAVKGGQDAERHE